jgi:hypothetical protein
MLSKKRKNIKENLKNKMTKSDLEGTVEMVKYKLRKNEAPISEIVVKITWKLWNPPPSTLYNSQ